MSVQNTRFEPTLDDAGARLDQYLTLQFPAHSRANIQRWIKDGLVTHNGATASAKIKLKVGDTIEVNEPSSIMTESWAPEALPTHILHEDSAFWVINKPAGLVVHPGAGNHTGTLVNALLHHDPRLSQVPRAGIVHRLDKDTSGLLVVARTPQAHLRLTEQLQARSMKRCYQAIVNGTFVAGGTVEAPVGRHAQNRLKMAVTQRGKDAITHYRIIQNFRAQSLLRIQLETGRTHQIRVHMASIKHAIVGDKLYGGRPHLPKAANPELITQLQSFPRQALHACELSLIHPTTQATCHWEAPLPEDMQTLLAHLSEDATKV